MKPDIDVLKIGINAIKEQMEKEDDFNLIMRKHFDSSLIFLSITLSFGIIKMLESIYKDSCGTISWWIYELDFGTKANNKEVAWDKDKTPIPMATIDDLYNHLIKMFE